MKATISLDSLWQLIQTLSPVNRKWLLKKLEEDMREREKKKKDGGRVNEVG